MRRLSPLKLLLAAALLLLALLPEPPRPIPQPPTPASSRSVFDPPWLSVQEQRTLEVKRWRASVWLLTVAENERRAQQEGNGGAIYPSEESQHVAHFDPGSVQQLIVDVFGAASSEALSVGKCESNFRADAVNGRYRGVFQVGDMHAAAWLEVVGRNYWDSWMDPTANVTYAHSLYLSAGWGPWQCKP